MAIEGWLTAFGRQGKYRRQFFPDQPGSLRVLSVICATLISVGADMFHIHPNLHSNTPHESSNDSRRCCSCHSAWGRLGSPAPLTASVGRVHVTKRASASKPAGRPLRYINAWLSAVIPCVTSNRGVVDKFMGDGFVGFFPDAESAVVSGVHRDIALLGQHGHGHVWYHLPEMGLIVNFEG